MLLTRAAGCYFLNINVLQLNQVQSKEDVQLGANIHKLSIRCSQLNFECLETQEHRTLLCGRLEDSLWMRFCIVGVQHFSF